MPESGEQHVLVVGGIKAPQDTMVAHGCRITWMVRKHPRNVPDKGDIERCQNIFLHDQKMADNCLIDIAEAMHEHDPFDAVCAFHDETQLRALAIAGRLGLDFPYSAEVVGNIRNKYKTRVRLASEGINNVRFGLAESTAEVNAQLARFNGVDRIILKPPEGTGSEDVLAVDPGRVQDLIDGGTLKFPLTLEEFVDGREFSVEAFTHGGKHHVIAITEKFKHAGSFIESGHLVPARLTMGLSERISDFVDRVLTALGVTCGATHTEVIASDDRVALVETHTRSGGDQIPLLVKYALGVDLYELMGLQAIGEQIDDSKLRPRNQGVHACIQYIVQEESDTPISKISGVAEAEGLPGVEEVVISVEPGDKLRAVKHSFDRAGSVLTVGDSADCVLSLAARAIETIEISL